MVQNGVPIRTGAPFSDRQALRVGVRAYGSNPGLRVRTRVARGRRAAPGGFCGPNSDPQIRLLTQTRGLAAERESERACVSECDRVSE